jgi:hypothetical protein
VLIKYCLTGIDSGTCTLIIRKREDATRILGIVFDSHVDLRKLIVEKCNLGEDSTGILTNIMTLYPELEAVSLEDCSPITPAGYCLIAQLKKLSELNLLYCQVDCVYVKLLETNVCMHEHM